MTSQVSGNVLVPDIWRTLDFVSTLVRTNVIFKSSRAHSAIFTDRTYNNGTVSKSMGSISIMHMEKHWRYWQVDATVKLFAHFQD